MVGQSTAQKPAYRSKCRNLVAARATHASMRLAAKLERQHQDLQAQAHENEQQVGGGCRWLDSSRVGCVSLFQ